MGLKDKVKSKGFWAAVTAAAAGVLAGTLGVADGVKAVVEALLGK